MTHQQTVLFPPRTVEELIKDIEYLTAEIQELYCADQIPWVLGYSGGKDSSAIVQLIWNAIAQLPPEKLTKIIYIITTDTLVENPIVSAWVTKSLARMKITAQNHNLPIEPHLLIPEAGQSYWTALIGKGYPTPSHQFRWCTPRLKIDPSNRFIRNVIRSNGEAIVVLGTRKTESSNRAEIMAKREKGRVRERLCPHPHLPSSLLYTPIENWRNDEVWMYLMQWENPWGHSNKDLFAMYRGATEDNDCPLVVDTSTPSCGNSRFGCWVCTLVDSDKSLTAMIQNDEEKEWLQPLVDFRLELDNDRAKRDFRRIWGNVQLFERNIGDGNTNIEPVPGPYTKEAREDWLRKLLEAQQKVRATAPDEMKDITLITQEELSEIRRIWLEEKHEFDDSLPRIYQEVIGSEFEDPRLQNQTVLLGAQEWHILEEICADQMYLELMTKLLDTERQYFTKSRRSGIINELEKCFDTSSRSRNDAIDHAHQKRDLKQAVQEADFEVIEQIIKGEKPHKERVQEQNWGMLKFPNLEDDTVK
jgi:DNA sulfur modification protein DndC